MPGLFFFRWVAINISTFMKIGIIVAMQSELALVLEALGNFKECVATVGTVYTGRLFGHDIMVTKCGIGKVNAAVGALDLINCFAPDVVINTGVAGGTGAEAKIGDVILASGVAYHDTWCGPGTERGSVQGLPDIFVPQHDTATLAAEIGAGTGLVASGDIFVSEPDDFRRVMAVRPDAAAIDMESGAIAQVCFLKSVPFLCLRIVSDTPGDGGNEAQYVNFWSEAPRAVFGKLVSLIERL